MSEKDRSANSACPRCGQAFYCGFSLTPVSQASARVDAAIWECWCAAQFPRILKGEPGAKACLCPQCLGQEIDSRGLT
jgi:hypothetical protein